MPPLSADFGVNVISGNVCAQFVGKPSNSYYYVGNGPKLHTYELSGFCVHPRFIKRYSFSRQINDRELDISARPEMTPPLSFVPFNLSNYREKETNHLSPYVNWFNDTFSVSITPRQLNLSGETGDVLLVSWCMFKAE